jgi:hypothetical protein
MTIEERGEKKGIARREGRSPDPETLRYAQGDR